MTYLLLAIIVGMLSYQSGRISPDPMRRWELKLRQRAFEWRIWWIDECIRKAEERKVALIAAMKEES